MNELVLRGRDRYRPSWSLLAVSLVVLAVEGAAAARGLGLTGFLWLAGGSLALLGLCLALALRGFSAVGPEGITICWGFGHGRTHPWHEIRWIDVRTGRTEGGTGSQVRIFLADGRRRALPGLVDSPLYPSPDFEEQYRRIVARWELNTEESGRVRPRKRLRDRITPTVAGLLAGLALIPAGLLVLVLMR
ncbi:hypothetical protein ABT093_04575 [Kitasatospora sp. NPDC002551]|uniref:hypothetical protein n=1 Tax=Kitasatospora sp. NPDC002551 TaxID=3154539 RepID=UPI00331DB041